MLSRTGEISGQFVVRGGLPDQNVFKLDGAPVYQPWHSQGLFSILQPSTVNDLKLFAGPLPADQGGFLASVLDAELSSGGPSAKGYAGFSSTVAEVGFSGPVAGGVTAMIAARHSHPRAEPNTRGESSEQSASRCGIVSRRGRKSRCPIHTQELLLVHGLPRSRLPRLECYRRRSGYFAQRRVVERGVLLQTPVSGVRTIDGH